jgi:hypothetical protein
MIVSVGLVVENDANIVPLKIGGIEDNVDIFDLAVIYTQSEVSSIAQCSMSKMIFDSLYHLHIDATQNYSQKVFPRCGNFALEKTRWSKF